MMGSVLMEIETSSLQKDDPSLTLASSPFASLHKGVPGSGGCHEDDLNIITHNIVVRMWRVQVSQRCLAKGWNCSGHYRNYSQHCESRRSRFHLDGQR